jgi:hypothetical protein
LISDAIGMRRIRRNENNQRKNYNRRRMAGKKMKDNE